MTKQADSVQKPDRHGMSDILNRYIDSLISEGKRSVIDERNQAVTDLIGKWNKNVSDLIGRRNTEIDTLKSNMPASQISFTTGAGLTAGGYGLGRLAALSKRIGKAQGGRAGMIGAGLSAGGIMLKDKVMPGKAKLPGVIPDQWVDPSNPSPKMPDPNLFQKIKNLIGLGTKQNTRRWVTDKKYPGTISGGTAKPQPKQQPKLSQKPKENKTNSLAERMSALVKSVR
jgi:hypothetical protein